MAANKNEETGVIMKIQKQSGCLLIVIGAAMLAFVLTDLLKSGPSVFSGSQNVIGEIAGDKVSYEEYSNKVEDLKAFYQGDLGGSGDESQFREMAWNQMIQDKIIKREHQLLGIQVGPEEFKDITTGAHPDPSIIQAFQDQETKEFNRNQLINFLEVQMQEDERKYRIWYNYYEMPLRERTEGTKYDKMVKSGVYVTKLDANYDLKREQYEVAGEAVGLSYASVSDSSITYTDDDLKAYIREHADRYDQVASRDIDFVVINVLPKAEDTLEAKKWAEGFVDKFKNAKRDSNFVMINRSSTPFDANFKPRGSFPPVVEDQLFAADTGTVIGPIFQEGTYSLYKVTAIKNDSVGRIKARHVLIPLTEIENDADGLTKGNKLMAELRSGAKDFNEQARSNYDGTGGTNGDLGWISEEGYTSVPSELRDKLFEHRTGDWFVLKTSRGVHVVNVTEGPSFKTIQVAVMSRSITPGTKADQEAVRLAADIQYQAQENEDFMAVVEGLGQRVREATKIRVQNPSIPGIQDPKDIIRWLYDDKTAEGSVSDVIDLQDRYVVAKCRVVREKGTAKLNDVRDGVITDYIQTKKAEQLIDQLNAELAKNSDAETVAKNLNTAVRVIPTVSMSSPQVTGIGPEPKVQGVLLGLKDGQRSEPIEGGTGVYVVWNKGQVKTEGHDGTVDERLTFLRANSDQMVDATVLEALRSKGEIVDNRYKFY
ncbi:MAG: SurA N-terminal domain-containing protein [Flavobacteriales bacterium]|nr:SurA N-terminal domain-containing protein [Bacteroidota bacterium]MCB9240713.1 SurA N-terminal domain-containing protein [Flavobacteriales bacterium]